MRTTPWRHLGDALAYEVSVREPLPRRSLLTPAEVDALVQAQFEAAAPARPASSPYLRPRPKAEGETGLWAVPEGPVTGYRICATEGHHANHWSHALLATMCSHTHDDDLPRYARAYTR